MHFKKVAVIGAGGWGTALAGLLASDGMPVRLWARSPDLAEAINRDHTNSKYLAGVTIPSAVHATPDLGEAVGDADLILFVTPSVVFRSVAGRVAELGPRSGAVLVSCTKGIEHTTGLVMTQILSEVLPDHATAVLSGPNHAEEVACGIPAATVIGCHNHEIAIALQSAFSRPAFRVYSSEDVIGIQLGGALKNIFAIAAGVSDGLGLGDNAKAALVTRSLAEMVRLGTALGGHRDTFGGLSGVGDLMVTCFSRHSRNRAFGERVGRGESCEAIAATLATVAEGVPTSRSARERARLAGIDAPITGGVFSVLHENKSPGDGVMELLGRPPKHESERK